MNVRYLTPENLRLVHQRIVDDFGGEPGYRDAAAVDRIATRTRISAHGQEMFQDVYGKAASLFLGILGERPFRAGNKRVAIAAAGVFLSLNGQELLATDHELVDFCLSAERGSLDTSVVRNWFRVHTAPSG